MKNFIMVKFIFLFLILLLTGCSGRASSGDEAAYVIALPVLPGAGSEPGDPYPAPEADLAQFYGAPPPAELHTAQGGQVAALGSTCWTQELVDGAPVENCLENPGIPTPQTFLPVDTQFSGRLRLPLPIPPTGVSIFLMPVTPADVLEPPADGVILWPYRQGDAIPLSTESEQELQLELSPGLNVLYVNAHWDGLGTAGFGFLLEARTP